MDGQKKGRLVLCESGPECVRSGELSASSEEANRFSGHFGVLVVGATGVGRGVDGRVDRFNEVVAEKVVFDLFAGDVGEHHAVDLDARRERLAGLLHHLGVIRAIIDDVDVLERQVVLPEDRTDAIGPAAGRLKIGFDVHAVSVVVGKSGAR